MKFSIFNSQEEIDNLKKEVEKLKRALQSATDKLKNKTAENERILQEKETVLHQYYAVVDQLHKCPPKFEDHCYLNAVETVQKLRADNDKLNEALNDSLARRDELEREIERLNKTKGSEAGK